MDQPEVYSLQKLCNKKKDKNKLQEVQNVFEKYAVSESSETLFA